ncbi:MAG TPA: hypothetical protein VGI39_35815 [Polyangiaceae bacterium]|jgi:hypothetical protein
MSAVTHLAREPFARSPGNSPADAPAARRRTRALECRVDGGTIALSVEAVGQIVEYDVAPLPLARGAVRGLGLVDGRLVVSLGIGRAPPVERRRTKGLLLRTAEASGHWALEVLEVLSFVETGAPSADEKGPCVSTDDARRVAWVDVEQLIAGAGEPFVEGTRR